MYVPTPGKKTTGLEPHPCVVFLLTLSLANYILLSPVCWVSLNGLPCGFTLEACYPLPAVLVVYLLTLSLANYILLSPVCWIALEGHPAGLPLRLVIPCLRCLGLPGWRALKGCPAGLPLRLVIPCALGGSSFVFTTLIKTASSSPSSFA